ncbi:SGNH/GDSL hydrolase family protein [Klebsiella aerogenes]|nr:SGNH/GDSL hydrolase family protein [Klebsiella aerogenes]MDN3810066.1 SGNH/GDSL hydrolase family protein [Klebsiella aerogenes]
MATPLPTPTQNPVPSTDIRDAVFAGAKMDEIVTSPSEKYVDRFGNEHYTIEGIRQNLIPLSRQYMTLEDAQADIANIPEGSTTYYRSPDDSALAIEVINHGGTLEPTGRKMPSQAAVDEISDRIPYVQSPNDKVPLFVDEENNVPVWLESGKLNAVALADNIRDSVDEGVPQKVPLFVDESGNVPVWLENGQFNAVALSPSIRDSVEGGINKKTPLFVDEENNVPVWLESGKLNSVALHEDLLTGLVTSAEFDAEISEIKYNAVSQGKTLWTANARKAQLDNGVAQKLKIGFTGDSWTAQKTIPQVFCDYLYTKYGKAGEGWIQLAIENDGLLNDITVTKTGWSFYDASQTTDYPTFPTSMDGQYAYSSGTAAVLTLGNVFATSVKIFYYDGDGTFGYSVNGGSAITVVCNGTNKVVSTEISGLDITVATTVNVSLANNTGTVVLYGFYAEGGGSGVEIDKMGNGGITAPGYTKTLNYLPQTAAAVQPDLLFMIIGTNDFRKSVPLSEFQSSLTAWVSAWQSACPNAGIILVMPALGYASGENPFTTYRDIMYSVAVSRGVEFFSLYDFMPVSWTVSKTLNAWADDWHLNANGARILFNHINMNFLGV